MITENELIEKLMDAGVDQYTPVKDCTADIARVLRNYLEEQEEPMTKPPMAREFVDEIYATHDRKDISDFNIPLDSTVDYMERFAFWLLCKFGHWHIGETHRNYIEAFLEEMKEDTDNSKM